MVSLIAPINELFFYHYRSNCNLSLRLAAGAIAPSYVCDYMHCELAEELNMRQKILNVGTKKLEVDENQEVESRHIAGVCQHKILKFGVILPASMHRNGFYS